MALLELKNITKSFQMGETTLLVLKGIDIEIERGEFLAITGPSGSGKSTLMHLIGCLDTATSGDYLFEGQNIFSMTSDQLAAIRNQRIGFVFQKFHLLSDLRAIDNVALPQLYANKNEKEAQAQAQEKLKLVELEDRMTHFPNQLSGGQQQRVAIARALVNDPDILLADEPTGNLDTATGATIMNILRHLNEEHGATIIIVTHDLELASKTNRMIKLKDGLIVEDTKKLRA